MSAKKKKWKDTTMRQRDLKEKSNKIRLVYENRAYLDFRCEECDCRSFSFCDELQPDGSYASGKVKRCHNCKHLQ
jgi:hypothetical protein